MSEDSISINSGNSEAEIDSTGAYVRSLFLNGTEILKPSPDGVQTHGGMALLLPFANRVRDATYQWEGTVYNLPRNNGQNSIHGLTKDQLWGISHRGSDTVTMACKLDSEGYPVPLYLKVTYKIEHSRFSIEITANNEGSTGAPFLAGIHPYFNTYNEWQLSGNRHFLELNYKDSYFPDGTFSACQPGSIGSHSKRSYDKTFIAEGPVELHSGKNAIRIANSGMPYLVVYNGDYSEGKSVALEPMTGAPDAYNNGIGLITILPGASFTCSASFELIR